MQDDLDKKIEEIIERKLELILEKQEELKKKKEEEEKQRAKYVQQIWSYFPGAKTKNLSTEELQKIAKQLDELAQKLKYTPVLPREAKRKFFGNKKGRKLRIAAVIILIAVAVGAAITKFLWGW